MAGMQEYFRELRESRTTEYPWNSHGIALESIENIIAAMDIKDPNCAGAILALLDDDLPNYYKSARDVGRKFAEGASTAQIGCHVGIFQRGGAKLDREGRDYWIKPLREVGAIEAVYCDPQTGAFLPGHPKAKSPNNCYRLDSGFVSVLLADNPIVALGKYLAGSAVGKRLALQAKAATLTAQGVGSGHSELIRACSDLYAPSFLPSYKAVYMDDGDGDRITDEQRTLLAEHNIELTLGDSYPDIILIRESSGTLWFVEAVTSDGEVDEHKVNGCKAIAERAGLEVGGYTTAYPTWKLAANRQSRNKNIAPGTHVWILEDAGKQYYVEEPE